MHSGNGYKRRTAPPLPQRITIRNPIVKQTLVRLAGLIAFAGYAALVSCSSVEAQGIFPDKALEAAVRQEVFAKRYNTEPITADDVKNISEVKGVGKGIENLEGLQHCVALQMVNFKNNKIKDLAPMKELKLLQQVFLNGNQIESIEPLSGLIQMQYLELSNNKVSDLTALKAMSNMRSLYLSDNQIKSLEPIGELKKVWSLYVARNPIENFAPVGNLKWLTHFDGQGCKIKDLSFLKPLAELKYLMLADNELGDLGPLVEMCAADMADRKQFAPFLQVYLPNNPLQDKCKNEQLPKLKEFGVRIHTEPLKKK